MSDTPRTDAEVESEDVIGHYGTDDPAFQIHRVPADFARELERELNRMRIERDVWRYRAFKLASDE